MDAKLQQVCNLTILSRITIADKHNNVNSTSMD